MYLGSFSFYPIYPEVEREGTVPKSGRGVLGGRARSVFLATVFLAEVVPLYVLPESLGHLGWGDLLSFLPTEYSGEMFV